MIIAAAIRYKGLVYSLPSPARHHDVIHFIAQTIGKGVRLTCAEDQGFITSGSHEYVDRIEGAKIALESGQLEKLNHPPRLYSEDLW